MSTKVEGSRGAVAGPAGSGGQGRGEFAAVLEGVLDGVPEPARAEFVRSVEGGGAEELDAALWGAGPAPGGHRQAALENLRRAYTSRRAVLADSLTRAEAAELLGVSEQAVTDRLRAGDLLGLKQGRQWRLPTWQFTPDAERGFVPGLARLRRVFPGGVVSLTQWVTRANVELAGASPAQALTAGRVSEVVALAAAGTAAAW